MSSNVKGNTIYLTRGDSFRAIVGIYNADGTDYVPEEGDVVRFALKHTVLSSEPILVKVLDNNDLLLSINPSDTEGLQFGTYVYDIEITKADGTVDTFITPSPFILTAEVD